jgi:hypothetical protein
LGPYFSERAKDAFPDLAGYFPPDVERILRVREPVANNEKAGEHPELTLRLLATDPGD